jgi:limonene-1,2-epoxide hydrolase
MQGVESSDEASEELIREFVIAFMGAWPSGDASELGRFFADDAVYRNGPLAPVRGRELIVDELSQMMRLGGTVDVEFIHVVADQGLVMTERVDAWTSAEHAATLRVAGVFEVDDGVISAWRDYFDINEFTAQVVAEPDVAT